MVSPPRPLHQSRQRIYRTINVPLYLEKAIISNINWFVVHGVENKEKKVLYT